MALAKGAGLEELTRAFFARQGFFAVRSVSIQFEEEEVTDVDVWLYGRQGGGVRTRALVDVKDKKSPKAFERVMWVRGMQLALGCERAVVATTDTSPKVARFAQQHKVNLLTANFLRRWATEDILQDRLSLEEFHSNIQQYPDHKLDGDWIAHIASAKSAVVSLAPYPAFNKAMSSFRFFAERAATRPQHREQALRGAFLCAGLACTALDSALERVAFEEPKTRFNSLYAGVTYGDAGDNRVRRSIDTVLSVISKSVQNGGALARQTADAIDRMFEDVRAEIIAEFFAKEQNAVLLFPVARELESLAHKRGRSELVALSVEAKAIIGLFADFVNVRRPALLNNGFVSPEQVPGAKLPASLSPHPEAAATQPDARGGADITKPKGSEDDPNPKLL